MNPKKKPKKYVQFKWTNFVHFSQTIIMIIIQYFPIPLQVTSRRANFNYKLNFKRVSFFMSFHAQVDRSKNHLTLYFRFLFCFSFIMHFRNIQNSVVRESRDETYKYLIGSSIDNTFIACIHTHTHTMQWVLITMHCTLHTYFRIQFLSIKWAFMHILRFPLRLRFPIVFYSKQSFMILERLFHVK